MVIIVCVCVCVDGHNCVCVFEPSNLNASCNYVFLFIRAEVGMLAMR